MSISKKALRGLLTIPWISAPFWSFQSECATIFMVHRFKDTEQGVGGMDPEDLRQGLDCLRRKRYQILPLIDIFQRFAEPGRRLHGAVAFTMDEGYIDQATIGGPIFAEFDCPVTTFVTTGFLDKELWFWWDQIEYILCKTMRRSVRVRLGEWELAYAWNNGAERTRARKDYTERCKEVTDTEKHDSIARFAKEADVCLPKDAPIQYAPMSWEQVRANEKRGMTFGPHTVTHPVLSQASPDQARRELVDSWARLSAEALKPIPIFCYPNGRWRDFGPREIAVLKELKFMGAVVGEPGFASTRSFRSGEDGPYKVQRLIYPTSLPYLVQYVSGAERFKQMLRREV